MAVQLNYERSDRGRRRAQFDSGARHHVKIEACKRDFYVPRGTN